MKARAADFRDAEELVRLRGVMLASLDNVPVPPGTWSENAVALLGARLSEARPTLAAYVVERPDDSTQLAACAVGTIELRLGGPTNPSGQVGYVFSVATDAAYRRRGYSRACMEALLTWFVERGITKVDLKASPDGEPLYTSLGFRRTADPAMRWTRPHG